MNKFKVGDKIVGTSDKYSITKKGWVGKVFAVDGKYIRVCKIGDEFSVYNTYTVDPKHFEKYEKYGNKSANEKIVIKNDGKTTQAVYYVDDEAKEIAQSTCHPDDDFDFMVGAAIATERLIEKINKSKLYTGKVVCVETFSSRQFIKGKIYTINKGNFTDDTGVTYSNVFELDTDGHLVDPKGRQLTISKFLEVVE